MTNQKRTIGAHLCSKEPKKSKNLGFLDVNCTKKDVVFCNYIEKMFDKMTILLYNIMKMSINIDGGR